MRGKLSLRVTQNDSHWLVAIIDKHLNYIETVRYRDYAIKLARMDVRMKAMIYPPGELLATRSIEDHLSNYENTISSAKALIDEMIAADEGTDAG